MIGTSLSGIARSIGSASRIFNDNSGSTMGSSGALFGNVLGSAFPPGYNLLGTEGAIDEPSPSPSVGPQPRSPQRAQSSMFGGIPGEPPPGLFGSTYGNYTPYLPGWSLFGGRGNVIPVTSNIYNSSFGGGASGGTAQGYMDPQMLIRALFQHQNRALFGGFYG